MIVCHGHQFVSHKSSEMICWSCGFVIWSVESVQDAEQALTELQGGQCPDRWHAQPLPFEKLHFAVDSRHDQC